eukprot:TRINITY_DN17_c0_g1_i5.p1 TRINITY_DN17_c0_g1~~TRINITY_DN17_c0_g1_i5.p1  ORF type:complete len:233 (-),score=119.97 TRINITY_DN17_c0_g1_i5:312-968(-)
MLRSLVGSEMCIRDRYQRRVRGLITSAMSKVEEPVETVEDVEEDDSTDDDMPEMEDGDDEKGRAKQSRSEKKSRKAMQKLGMKPFPGIVRVTVKKSKNILFVIKDPDVFRTNDSGSNTSKGPQTFVVFGKAEIEDLSQQATNAAVEQFKPPSAADASKAAELVEEVDGDDDGDEDAGDLDENDIELVVKQAGVSRAKAIKALKLNDKDVVNAIMALSS